MADPFLKMVAGVIERGGLPYERIGFVRTGGFVTSVTFSGLDGNADGAWLLVGQYVMRSNLGDIILEFEPNGVSAGAGDSSLRQRLNDSLVIENDYLSGVLRLIDIQSQNAAGTPRGIFVSYISCSALRGRPRMIHTYSTQEDQDFSGAVDRVGHYTTKLNSVGSGNWTSFDINSTAFANAIGPNSEFSLFRVPGTS